MSNKRSDNSPKRSLHDSGNPLPDAVLRSYERWVGDQLKPFCLEFDVGFAMLGQWGEAAHYGFADVAVGSDIGDLAPFLIGLDTTEPVALRFVSDREQRRFHVLVVVHDARRFALYVDAQTQHDRLQRAQQRSNDTALLYERQNKLVQQLIDASTELDARRRDAEAEGQRKQRYLHAMSHDLKAPLQSLMLTIDALHSDPDLSPTSIDSVARLRGAVERQVQVLDGLIEEGRSQLDVERSATAPVDVANLMAQMSEMFALFAAEKALRFDIAIAADVPGVLMLDEIKLRRVLINLIGNAIKFTERGAVHVSVGADAGMLVVLVEDSGPGIKDADRERIFEPYERSDTQADGSGLGLAIVARLMKQMHGQIALLQLQSRGSAFEIRLPLVPVVDDIRQALRSGDVDVLVCDDDRDITDLLSMQLRRAGVSVRVCDSQQTVLARIAEKAPDIIVLDARLGDMAGTDIAQQLRKQGNMMPLLLFSSVSAENGRQMALASGCNDFLAKPVSANVLLERIEHILQVAARRGSNA
ncbi:MAG: hybrid sensor histidine kinase/response regulator [Pseudomonadota bacterium]